MTGVADDGPVHNAGGATLGPVARASAALRRRWSRSAGPGRVLPGLKRGLAPERRRRSLAQPIPLVDNEASGTSARPGPLALVSIPAQGGAPTSVPAPVLPSPQRSSIRLGPPRLDRDCLGTGRCSEPTGRAVPETEATASASPSTTKAHAAPHRYSSHSASPSSHATPASRPGDVRAHPRPLILASPRGGDALRRDDDGHTGTPPQGGRGPAIMTSQDSCARVGAGGAPS